MAHRYAHGDIVAAINKQFEGLQPFGGVIDRPSLSWTHAPKQSQSAAYHRYSRGTALQIIDGTNDMVVNVAYSPQGPLESVILHKFTDYYMKHAEDLSIFRKRPYDSQASLSLHFNSKQHSAKACTIVQPFIEEMEKLFDELKMEVNSFSRNQAKSLLSEFY